MEICVPRLLSHAPLSLPLPLRRPPSHPLLVSLQYPLSLLPETEPGPPSRIFPNQHKNGTFAARSSTSEDISASISSQLDEQPGKVVITDETEAAEEVDESPKKYETPVPTVEVTPPSEDISASISRQLDEQPGKVVITDESEAAEEVDESTKKYETPVPTVEVTPSSEDIYASISMQLDEQPGKKVITDETEAAEEVDESPKKCETPVPTVEVTPTSEDISAIISRQLDEQPGQVVITDETETAEEVYESPKKYKTPVPTVEVTPSEEEPTESQSQSFQLFGDFNLDDFNLELKEEDIYPILLYGGGSLLTLWISFAILGAIDSIPLIPKMLEVVGLGYTVWFSYQYLIFKKNRDELVAKIEGLRKEIIGGSEDV